MTDGLVGIAGDAFQDRRQSLLFSVQFNAQAAVCQRFRRPLCQNIHIGAFLRGELFTNEWVMDNG
jgi:hypothetical protein